MGGKGRRKYRDDWEGSVVPDVEKDPIYGNQGSVLDV